MNNDINVINDLDMSIWGLILEADFVVRLVMLSLLFLSIFSWGIIFEKINDFKILKKNSIIILHRHNKEEDIFPKNFKIIEEKKYGISKIIFLSNSS